MAGHDSTACHCWDSSILLWALANRQINVWPGRTTHVIRNALTNMGLTVPACAMPTDKIAPTAALECSKLRELKHTMNSHRDCAAYLSEVERLECLRHDMPWGLACRSTYSVQSLRLNFN